LFLPGGQLAYGFEDIQMIAAAVALSLPLSVIGLPPLLAVMPLLLCVAYISYHDWGRTSTPNCIRIHKDSLYLLYAFLVSYVLATIFSTDRMESLETLFTIVPGCFMAWLLQRIPEEQIRTIVLGLALMACSAVVVVLIMMTQSPGTEPALVLTENRNSALVVPNDLILAVILAPLLLAYCQTSSHQWARVSYAAFLIAACIAIYQVQSRLCLLTLTLILMIQLYRYHRSRFLVILIAAGSALLVLNQLLELNILRHMLMLSSENARLSIWASGLISSDLHPLLGLGPGQFDLAYLLGQAGTTFPDWIMVDPRGVPWAHNLYLESLVERGALGLVTLLLLLWVIYRSLYRTVQQSSGEKKLIYLAILLAFVAFLFAGFFELTLQRSWVANLLLVFWAISARAGKHTRRI
jgi:O-antigen ligase